MQSNITVPQFDKDTVSATLSKDTPFTDIDSNLAAWLNEDIAQTSSVSVEPRQLLQASDNKQLVEFCGGESELGSTTVTLKQVRNLVERQLAGENILLTNGYSNLFFAQGKDGIYIIGVVFDQATNKFVPYIYRRKNLYRAWSKGNRVFLVSQS